MEWYKSTDFWMIVGEVTSGIVAFGLLILGFLCPPLGIIDNSVVQAAGEILGFATIWMLPSAIKAGANIKLQHGSNSVIVSKNDAM